MWLNTPEILSLGNGDRKIRSCTASLRSAWNQEALNQETEQAGEMAQWSKLPAAKPGDLSSVPGNLILKGENHKFSDFHRLATYVL